MPSIELADERVEWQDEKALFRCVRGLPVRAETSSDPVISIWLKGLTAALATAMAAATLPTAVVAAAMSRRHNSSMRQPRPGCDTSTSISPRRRCRMALEFVVGGGMSVLDCDDDAGRICIRRRQRPGLAYRNESEPVAHCSSDAWPATRRTWHRCRARIRSTSTAMAVRT